MSPLPSWGPKRGQSCYVTPAFSGGRKRAGLRCNPCILGGPQQRRQNQKWLPHPCLLGGPKEGRIATQPLHSRGSPTKGTKSEVAVSPVPSQAPKRGQNCYVSRAFSGIPNKGDKIRSGCLTLASSGAQKRAELLCIPCILEGPQKGAQKRTSPGQWKKASNGGSLRAALDKKIWVPKDHPDQK